MSWQLVSLASVAATPWRNGGGVTRELAAWPSVADWVWRLSVADVDSSGPFSTFQGVDRWFAVLSGAGVQLDVNGEQHRLTRGSDPFFFDGAALTDCVLLDGETRDFNLMVRQNHGSSRMRRVENSLATELGASTRSPQTLAIYAASAGACVVLDGQELQLPPATLAWQSVTQKASLHIEAQDALYLEISP